MQVLQRRQLAEQEKTSAEQARVLKLQAEELQASLDERKREAERQRRAQASYVFITEDKRRPATGSARLSPRVDVTVQNSSNFPVYNAEVRWHLGPGGHGEPWALGVLLPGAEVRCTRDYPGDANLETCGAWVRFTDAAGVRWLRRPDGYLSEEQ